MEKQPQRGLLPEFNPKSQEGAFNERFRIQRPLMMEAARQNIKNAGLDEKALKKAAVDQWVTPENPYKHDSHAAKLGAFMEAPENIDKTFDISTPEAVAELWKEVNDFHTGSSSTKH